MAKKKKTPAQRRDATDRPRPVVDSFKVFHISVALAPVFARHALAEGRELEVDLIAGKLIMLAMAIARRL